MCVRCFLNSIFLRQTSRIIKENGRVIEGSKIVPYIARQPCIFIKSVIQYSTYTVHAPRISRATNHLSNRRHLSWLANIVALPIYFLLEHHLSRSLS